MKTINKMKLIHKITMKHLINLALLSLTTLTLIACGGGSSGGGNSTPAPNTGDGGNGGGGTPDPTEIRISEATGDEGGMINFKVTASPNITKAISFSYRIDFANQTASAADLSGDFSGTSTIDANNNSTTISIATFDDDINEPAETFTITLSNLSPTSDATFTKKTAIGTISASDPNGLNPITIANTRGEEGSKLNFKVTTSATITEQISFQFEATLDNTTTAIGADLSGKLTGTSTIATNDSSVTISILTADDSLRENAETFLVILSDLSTTDATFTDHTAIGTILANDDATGIVTISLVTDATASEENTGRINFQVKSEFTAISPFTFGYEVIFGSGPTYASSDDFGGATNGTATIPAGKDSTTISISLRRDITVEPNETFRFLLTNPTSANAILDSANNSAVGTILNDDLGEISDATAIIGDGEISLKLD